MRGSDASSHHFFIGIVALDKIKKLNYFPSSIQVMNFT